MTLNRRPVGGRPRGASEHAALVVVGQRSREAPLYSVGGPTFLVLADQAGCLVVFARGAAGPERAGPPVVLGVPGDGSSRTAGDFAAYTAQIRSVPLTIWAASSVPPAREWSQGTHGFDTVAQWSRDPSARAAAAATATEDDVHRRHPAVVTWTRVAQLRRRRHSSAPPTEPVWCGSEPHRASRERRGIRWCRRFSESVPAR